MRYLKTSVLGEKDPKLTSFYAYGTYLMCPCSTEVLYM